MNKRGLNFIQDHLSRLHWSVWKNIIALHLYRNVVNLNEASMEPVQVIHSRENYPCRIRPELSHMVLYPPLLSKAAFDIKDGKGCTVH